MEYIEYFEEIKKHQSCRDFTDKAVGTDELKQLQEYFHRCRRLIPELKLEMLVYNATAADKIGRAAGYNGFLIGAPNYLLLFSETGDHWLENAGFVGEALTLKLTQMGIDSCWMTINDGKAIRDNLVPEMEKELGVLIAFGYKAKEEKLARLDIKSPSNVKMHKRTGPYAAPKIELSDLLYDKKWGKPVDVDLIYRDLKEPLLALGVSQSFFNRQPYRVILDDDIISLIAIPDEMTSEHDTKLGQGIAMFNFEAVLAAHRPTDTKWHFEAPDRDLGLPEDAEFVAWCAI
ncbi:nitroreductase family protein [Mobilibacterium timonense]|uniref:nitroreductase family protein n=1 Tax=Mobilibacterium timonense TaxID=1871012 RepID=UPI000987BFAF|nr:nitroreductase family protein [Mobilibacterium timonense]